MADLLTPQAALETAVANFLLLPVSQGGAGFLGLHCKRMFDDRPPPSCGPWFASVHSDMSRGVGNSINTSLDQRFGVHVTLTVRLVQPFDRWVTHKDFLEAKANLVVAAVHKDRFNQRVINAANTLAGYRSAGTPDGTHPVGFCESLAFAGISPVKDVGPDHFSASLDQPDKNCGLALLLRFEGARHVGDLSSMA